jgi:hypothetical protein
MRHFCQGANQKVPTGGQPATPTQRTNRQ